MKVICRHGHFAFYPTDRREVIRFEKVFALRLYAEDDYFTLSGLVGLPRWSQIARTYGTLPAVATYEGRNAWEVMAANEFVYSLVTGLLVPQAAIIDTVRLRQTQECALAPKPLVQPGSVLEEGGRLLGYDGDLDLTYQKLYIYSQETSDE